MATAAWRMDVDVPPEAGVISLTPRPSSDRCMGRTILLDKLTMYDTKYNSSYSIKIRITIDYSDIISRVASYATAIPGRV